MRKIFENADADFFPLVDYVDTFLNPENEHFNLFQLPPIQRNSVWNVAQIERLWDSILRGYPIGSFLVSPRAKGDKARGLYEGIQDLSAKDGFFLLDGQQRTRALLLGFKPNEDARLWIDLSPKLIFDNVEFNDRKFLFRVLTKYQPWGMNDSNPSDKLHENVKYDARGKLKIEKLHYDYEVKIDTCINRNDQNFYSWPIKAQLPVPFDSLVTLCGGYSGEFIMPEWNAVCDLVPKNCLINLELPIEPTENYLQMIEGIRKLICKDSNSKLKKNRTIVLLLQNESKIDLVDNIQDDMEVLFRRINSGGTVLQGEEMAYSLLKSSWDGAYDMVSKIVEDKKIGYLLSSTKLVMAASRMARQLQNENDIANPSIGQFRRWIGEKGENPSFLNTMQSLIATNSNDKSRFHLIIEIFCNTIVYRNHIIDDLGFPKKFLVTINPLLYHPVFIWINTQIENNENIENSRINILRYLLISFITKVNPDKASKIAIEILASSDFDTFPDRLIFDKTLEEEVTVNIPSPDEFSRPFLEPNDGFFRHWNDVFEIPNDIGNTMRRLFWSDSKEILIWFQRRYVSTWFPNYDPTSTDAYDTPYDWDHIMPKSHLITSGATANTYSDNETLNNKFHGNKHLYVNSIGNFRLWPNWANRSDNNQCHTNKLRMNEVDWDSDFVAHDLGIYSKDEFFNASAISLKDIKLWKDAGGEVRDWPLERRISWQNAVESRVCYLYAELYNSFRLHELKN